MSEYDFDDSGLRPIEERWPPLGAANPSENGYKSSEDERHLEKARVQELEEEHEELNSSLLALTTHFAQVQFRLKQVVAAPAESKEKLLLALEEFAFQGCPDVRAGSHRDTGGSCTPMQDARSPEKRLSEEKLKQERLIGQLKDQLEEMERCVAEGASDSLGNEMSPEQLVEKQRIVLEQLKARIGLKLDGIDKMSEEDVRRNVDAALGNALNPEKTKEQIVKQLTNQIMDLERFVQFLQGEVNDDQPKTEKHFQYPCTQYPFQVSEMEKRPPTHKEKYKLNNTASFRRSSSSLADLQRSQRAFAADYPLEGSDDAGDGCCLHVPAIPATPEQARSKRIRDASVAIIRRALAILQIFAISQFGCTGKQIQDQIIQKATNVAIPGYFDLLAKLQSAVDKVASLKYALDQMEGDFSEPCSPCSPDSVKSLSRQSSRRSRSSSMCSVDTAIMEEKFNYARDGELVNAVRKDLSMALKELLSHGLVRSVDSRIISSKSLVACIVPTTRTSLPKKMHVWELFNEYYNLKHGREYNSTPASRLSEAFGIQVDGSSAVTGKQTLLRTLHRIKSTHEPCRRSMDAMFKSLVCSGLNQKKLVQWCRIVMRTSCLVEEHYQSWSYVVKTGMSEAMGSLDRLQPFDFYLPEDLAIRHLTKINDAFGEP
ncbi:RUN domain-containing protein 1 isoform X2 [Nematostella vectensis]|uniref:RUN domain-containing protein 1 isoform X2 n=1 Tax=Nematostella vectensis TaxID=45351 RepID=UPI002076FD05|nr:RUN domain-containing protein 1 isoform X2 [Nematostella vectensis]